MSQTETLLLIVLGFALASLIALFAGRFVWHVALRLGARRMQKQVPLTLSGLQTERDRLRAEFAMLSQRLGSRLEAARLSMAEQMAEVSRHRNRLETTEAALAERTAEVETLDARVRALEADLAVKASEVADLEKTISARDAELAATHEQLKGLVAFETTVPVAASAGASPALVTGEDGLKQRIGRLNQLAKSVAQERASPFRSRSINETDSDLRETLAKVERETADISRELQKLDEEWSKRLGEGEDSSTAASGNDSRAAPPRAVANVISLANRIRALQEDIRKQ